MMTKLKIPIGPHHPLLKEPISFLLTVEGERVLESSMRLGYVHRGIERLCQERTYVQAVHLIERICGICSHVHSTTYCHAVETLLGLEVPLRAHYIRALLCELERIHSHLLIVLDIMEDLSGGRVSHAINVIGGVKIDLDQKMMDIIIEKLEELAPKLTTALGLFENEPTVSLRTQGIGVITKEEAARHCVVGPIARASGVDIDVRRDIPRPPYDGLEHTDGDVWARTLVRIRETRESHRLIQQIISQLPSGDIVVKAKRRVPPGEVVCRFEAPRGELFYYIRSDGSNQPARIKIRTPTLPALSTLPEQLRDVNLADAPVILSGVDLCIACADR